MRIILNYYDPIQPALKFLYFHGYGDRYFTLHKPHPGNILKRDRVEQIIEALLDRSMISQA